MASSTTEICNLAISHLGVGKEIANFDTERSDEASACRRFFETARDLTLRDFPWPFATKIADLGLVEEDPNDEWSYSYRYPSDCLRLRRILSGIRNDTRQSLIPFRISRDDAGLLIYTDQAEAELEYTIQETNVGRFPADFTIALSLRLAAYIAPRITGGDPTKLGERAIRFYYLELSKAQDTAMGEEQDDELPESEFIRVRD